LEGIRYASGKPQSIQTSPVLAEENIKKVECIDFPELGMEAV
jgi:tartrate dehydratase beta subunit/fumarate hydratase class I family protein